MKLAQRLLTRDIAKQNFLFLLMEDGTIMNGHWDVTETKEFLEGIRTGQEEVLKRLFSIPSNEGYTC
jgi:uncharacterized protein YunC (DUF1805 family)